jgi:hypothetical protein
MRPIEITRISIDETLDRVSTPLCHRLRIVPRWSKAVKAQTANLLRPRDLRQTQRSTLSSRVRSRSSLATAGVVVVHVHAVVHGQGVIVPGETRRHGMVRLQVGVAKAARHDGGAGKVGTKNGLAQVHHL